MGCLGQSSDIYNTLSESQLRKKKDLCANNHHTDYLADNRFDSLIQVSQVKRRKSAPLKPGYLSSYQSNFAESLIVLKLALLLSAST